VSLTRARKRFGQHFLVDQGIVRRIIELIAPAAGDHIVEIGPGRCALTEPLAAAAGRLTVIEIDRDLAAEVDARFNSRPNFSILTGDALKTDFRALGRAQSIRLVGNLPYNISTPLILALVAQSEVIVDMTFMLQKEVVDRLAARPDTSDYGRLTVMVQSRCQVDAFFDVEADAFRPQPKVVSKIVRITPHSVRLPKAVVESLEACVRVAFGQRRKTLRNTLGRQYEGGLLEACGIDLNRRPGELDVATYLRLARVLAGLT